MNKPVYTQPPGYEEFPFKVEAELTEAFEEQEVYWIPKAKEEPLGFFRKLKHYFKNKGNIRKNKEPSDYVYALYYTEEDAMIAGMNAKEWEFPDGKIHEWSGQIGQWTLEKAFVRARKEGISGVQILRYDASGSRILVKEYFTHIPLKYQRGVKR